jgi:hypothetical protein
MDLPGINIKVEVDGKGVTSGVAGVKGQLQGIGSEAEKTATRVQTSSAVMDGSVKGLAVGMSQTAVSAFALYSAIDNIEKKQYAYEKAQLAAKKATESVDQAQKNYNEAVAKFGTSSPEAIDAQDKLTLAQETAALAADRVNISQNNVNDSMMMAGLTIIPSVISGIDGMSRVWKNLQGLDVGGMIGGISGKLGDMKGALLTAGGAAGGILAIFGAFTTTSAEMRAALSLLAGGLIAAASAQWVMNIAATYGLGLTGAGLILIAVAGAAAAATYILSSQYGAKAQAPPGTAAAAGVAAAGGAAGGGGAGGHADVEGVAEMPGTAPGAGMNTDQMIAAGLGEYASTAWGSKIFEPYHEKLVHSPIAPKIRVGPNAGKYMWGIHGPAEGKYFTMEELESIRSGKTPDTDGITPWFTYGFEERVDEGGQIDLIGLHLQSGGVVTRPRFASIAEKGDEAVLPLSNPTAMDKIASAIGGAGRSVTNIFYINGARDVDLVMNEIARKMRTAGGMLY